MTRLRSLAAGPGTAYLATLATLATPATLATLAGLVRVQERR
jgi:hypothetical protein